LVEPPADAFGELDEQRVRVHLEAGLFERGLEQGELKRGVLHRERRHAHQGDTFRGFGHRVSLRRLSTAESACWTKSRRTSLWVSELRRPPSAASRWGSTAASRCW